MYFLFNFGYFDCLVNFGFYIWIILVILIILVNFGFYVCFFIYFDYLVNFGSYI